MRNHSSSEMKNYIIKYYELFKNLNPLNKLDLNNSSNTQNFLEITESFNKVSQNEKESFSPKKRNYQIVIKPKDSLDLNGNNNDSNNINRRKKIVDYDEEEEDKEDIEYINFNQSLLTIIYFYN